MATVSRKDRSSCLPCSPSPLLPCSPAIRRGAAAAELAIVLPFLALMFVAAVDFCRVYYAAQTVEECARSGALYASGAARRDTSTTTPEDAARQAAVAAGTSLDPPLQAQDVDVVIDGTSATVTVTYRFAMFTDYPGLPNLSVIRRSVTMALAPKAPGEN